jgi:hypothetical protein
MSDRAIYGEDLRQEAWLQDLKLIRDGSNNNKLVLQSSKLGDTPNSYNPIVVAIPTGNSIYHRKRAAAYLSGAWTITLVDGTAYWNRASASGITRYAYLYAIWDGTGIVFALGGHPRLLNVSTTTTATDADYLLLEDSSTYSRSSSHFCIAIAEIAYTYYTSDTPDFTIDNAKFRLLMFSSAEIVTEYRTFNSGYTVILASGTRADLDAITAVKSDPGGAILALTVTRPPTVRFITIQHFWTAAETTGKTQGNLYVPEPNGATTLLKSTRPLMHRLNLAGGQFISGSCTNDGSGNLTVTCTGSTGGQDWGFIAKF